MPDYSVQLTEIAQALNRPGVSPWLLASFSVFLGVIGGAIGRAVEQPIQDVFRKRRMRRVLYVDMAESLMLIAGTFGDEWKDTEEDWNDFRRYLKSGIDHYIASNQEVFTQLPERPHLFVMFDQFKLIVEEQDDRKAADRMLRTLELFQNLLEGDGFKRRYLRMALGKWRADNLIQKVNEVIEQNPAMLRA